MRRRWSWQNWAQARSKPLDNKLVSNFFLTLSFHSFFLGLGLTTLQSSLLTHKSSNNQNCQGSIKILWRCFSSDKVLGFFFKLSRFFVGFWKHFQFLWPLIGSSYQVYTALLFFKRDSFMTLLLLVLFSLGMGI